MKNKIKLRCAVARKEQNSFNTKRCKILHNLSFKILNFCKVKVRFKKRQAQFKKKTQMAVFLLAKKKTNYLKRLVINTCFIEY